MAEPVIVATARTPIGRAAKGSLVDVRPDDMSAFIVKDTWRRIHISINLQSLPLKSIALVKLDSIHFSRHFQLFVVIVAAGTIFPHRHVLLCAMVGFDADGAQTATHALSGARVDHEER